MLLGRECGRWDTPYVLGSSLASLGNLDLGSELSSPFPTLQGYCTVFWQLKQPRNNELEATFSLVSSFHLVNKMYHLATEVRSVCSGLLFNWGVWVELFSWGLFPSSLYWWQLNVIFPFGSDQQRGQTPRKCGSDLTGVIIWIMILFCFVFYMFPELFLMFLELSGRW